LNVQPTSALASNTATASNIDNEVLWFVRMGIGQRMFTVEQCRATCAALGSTFQLADFAQRLIDDDVTENIGALEDLAGIAMTKAAKGPPPENPFGGPLPLSSAAVSPAGRAAPALAAPPAPSPATKPLSTDRGTPLAFESINTLNDTILAEKMRELLRQTARSGASDLHLSTGSRPFARTNRKLSFLSEHALTESESLRLNTALLSPAQKKIFLERKDYDYALALSATDRYRVNLMVHKNGPAGAYRMVPEKVRPLSELGFAPHLATLNKLLSYHNGLILITGPVGSGKTTTLASMVDYLNSTRTDHIITVEDPIEVVQPAKGCNVSQREVGPHTKSFFTALKGALREDPDVIVIGELRDLETIEMAITASETGHLVIGTMHTSDATTTLTRLLDVFPPSQQTQIRASVAESLRGVVCQRLLPTTNGKLTLACEIMVNNTAIANLIREGKSQGLRNTMETGLKDGMCLMDNVIFTLWQEQKISRETALTSISNRVLRAKITS
jgi:twitching motility protein PilT